MKTLMKGLIMVALIFVVSCRDTKKEAEETEIALQQIEAVEQSIDSIDMEVDAKEDELKEALKELDSI